MREGSKQGFTDLSVKAPKELSQDLRRFVRLERCRSYREVIIYFLEVMIAVVRQRPGAHLVSPTASTRYKGQIRAWITDELYLSLRQTAEDFGMDAPEIVRVFVQMALDFHKKLVPKGEIVRKEEIVSKILETIDEQK